MRPCPVVYYVELAFVCPRPVVYYLELAFVCLSCSQLPRIHVIPVCKTMCLGAVPCPVM